MNATNVLLWVRNLVGYTIVGAWLCFCPVQKVGHELTFALNINETSFVEPAAELAENFFTFFNHLYLAGLSSTFHPAGHIDGVPPDIIVRLARPNDSSYDRPVVDTYPEYKIVERLFVDLFDDVLQGEGKVHKFLEMGPLDSVPVCINLWCPSEDHPAGRHVGGPHSFDFYDAGKFGQV